MMQRLKELSATVFPSDPTSGHIGSLDLNLWLAQVAGIPLLGLKQESFSLRAIVLGYGIVVMSLVTVIYTGCEVYDLLLHWNDLSIVTQNSCLSLTHVAGLIKILNTLYCQPAINGIIKKLKLITKTYVVTEQQRRAFYSGEFESKVYLAIYGSLVGFTGLLAWVMLYYDPLSVAGRAFPYRVILPAWLPYPVQLFYMGAGVFIFAQQIVAVDFLNITMMNQIRFQLTILNLSFDQLVLPSAAANNGGAASNAPPDSNGTLRSVVEHHCALLDLRSKVETIFRTPVLLQFFTSLVIFAMTGFLATVRAGDSQGAVLIYFYCGCIFCELFFYCWFGNAVSEQSKTLSTSGYIATWYEYDNRFKKSLAIFITNAERPFLFTAGGFMGLSLPSFAGILSKSYSYIAVLRQIYG